MNDIDNIDFNLYKTFLAVARTGSISKAAESLYVSQPAVSYGIKTLEKEIGCKLFNRTSKGVELTPDAKKLLFYVESAYNTIYTGHKILNDSTDLLNGEIRIGVPTHIGTFLISKYIQKFSEQYPGIKFYIVNKSTNEMVDLLEKRMLDIIIDSYPIYSQREDITISELIEIDNCFVGNEKYKQLSNKKKIRIEDMSKYPLILQPFRTSTRKLLEESIEEKNIELEPLIEVPTTEVMLDLVKRGMGIGYFAKPSVLEYIEKEKLFEIPVDINLPKTKICIAYVYEFLTNASKRFTEMLKKEIKYGIHKKEKALRVILTQNCIYNCPFCHKEGINTKKEELLNSEDIAYLYELANKSIGTKKVSLTGGEPLLRDDIEEIVKSLKEKGAKVTLTTNGYYIDKHLTLGNVLNKINISLHTLDYKKFIELCSKENALDRVVNNVKLLRAKYPTLNITINMTLSKQLNYNNEMIEKMIMFSNSVKAKLKIVELYSMDSKEYVSLDNIVPKLEKMGFKLIETSFRKKIYTNSKQKIILERCTCSAVSDESNKNEACKNNNDIFISSDGSINLCRRNSKQINILKEIKNRQAEEVKLKIEEACNVMGDNCPC